MQVYTELIAPTAVTHAVSLPFLQPDLLDLIVAKTDLLQIFQVRQSKGSGRDVGRPKLCLVGEYQLSGTITSLARIASSTTKSGGDAVLISFRDAKASLVEWNPETYNLTTISVHYYENEDLLGPSWAPDLSDCPSYLLVDPNSRCAALKFGIRHLAIIPFRQASDELTLGDYDPAMDEAPAPKTSGVVQGAKGAPYGKSFVLLLTELDPTVLHVEHLTFLHEYREPTLGVLSSANMPSHAISPERKDCLNYTAFTLDLQQRASTALLSVANLPSDLFKVVPLPLPVGGSLLIGTNELIHVDQAGKTHAVAVNSAAREASAFPMTDQTSLSLRLEGSLVVQITDVGEVVLVLNTGDMIIVKFQVDGRSISGLVVRRVDATQGGSVLGASASCAASLGPELLFLGSEEADSLLIQTRHRRTGLSRKRSHAEMLDVTENASDEEPADEDDLYGNGETLTRTESQSQMPSANEQVQFSTIDGWPNLASWGEPVFGKRRKTSHKLELAMATGCGRSSSISCMKQHIDLEEGETVPVDAAHRVWTLATAVQLGDDPNAFETSSTHNLVITSNSEEDIGASKVYRVVDGQLSMPETSYFETGVATLNAGVIHGGKKIVQVSPSEVRCYSLDLSYPQIFPMMDETGEIELKIKHSVILGPYILIVRHDDSCVILKADKKGELDEIEQSENLQNTSWASGSLHTLPNNTDALAAYLLSVDGFVNVFELPNLEQPIYSLENLNLLPPFLGHDFHFRRTANREKLVEIVVTDLGDASYSEYSMILRTASNGLAIYRPYYQTPQADQSLKQRLRWTKVFETTGEEDVAEDDNEDTQSPADVKRSMKVLRELMGHCMIFVPGTPSRLVIQEASSMPQMLGVGSDDVVEMACFDNGDTAGRFIVADSKGKARIAHLAQNTSYGSGWAVRRLPQISYVEAVCYHEDTGLYVACSNEPTTSAPSEDSNGVANHDFEPQSTLGHLKLVDSATGAVINETTIEPNETILCAQEISVEVSERTHDQRPMIIIGTAIMRGEDQPSNGAIYVYDIITVVPDRDVPGSDRALKLISREEVKGAVTCLTGIGADGLVIAAQGQKLMVRGLKEDDTMLPVAFMDVNIQVTALKSLKGTGMALMGDAQKGIWMLGYTPSPKHEMRLFGKSRGELQVVTAELLPYGKQLFAAVMDTGCNLHVFEYNPEDPTSLSGQRLLNRSTFHTGHYASAMIPLQTPLNINSTSHSSLPNADTDADNAITNGELTNGDTSPPASPSQHSTTTSILLTTQSGALALITPLSEPVYRRLSALQAHLSSILDHPCGLNPREYRAAESRGVEAGRAVLDGNTLLKWHTLSVPRKAEAAARVGSSVWEVRVDLRVIKGSGVTYF